MHQQELEEENKQLKEQLAAAKRLLEKKFGTAKQENNISENKGLRYNTNKRKWSLIHFKSLEPMVEVMEFGAKKYARDNWKDGFDRFEILESLQRHLAKLFDGEEIDQESGLHHIGHILCNAMFYSFYVDKEKSNK
jgi:hypothetical protein